jgi:hypothetical protein
VLFDPTERSFAPVAVGLAAGFAMASFALIACVFLLLFAPPFFFRWC